MAPPRRQRRPLPGARVRPVHVLDHLRGRTGRPRPDDRDAVPPRRTARPARHLHLDAGRGAGACGFLTEPEAELARRASSSHPPATPSWAPESRSPSVTTRQRFRAELGVEGPFLYYAGRREWGKGWDDLVAAFVALVRQPPDRSPAGHVRRRRDRRSRPTSPTGSSTSASSPTSSATARWRPPASYVQPSALESFSRTVLEAWVAGTPVVANAESAVVSWHVERSGSGLLYRSRAELIEALRFVADEPAAAAALADGAAGPTSKPTTGGRRCSTAWRRPSTPGSPTDTAPSGVDAASCRHRHRPRRRLDPGSSRRHRARLGPLPTCCS